MKSTPIFLLIIAAAFTLSACGENDNVDNTGTAETNVEEVVVVKPAETVEISQSIKESVSEDAEIIKENMESIHENEESNTME